MSIEQRIVFFDLPADKYTWQHLPEEVLRTKEGWRVVSVNIAGAGQDTYRSFGITVLLERETKDKTGDQSAKVMLGADGELVDTTKAVAS